MWLTRLALRGLAPAAGLVLLTSCAPATQPESAARPGSPQASPSAGDLSGALLTTQDLPGSWKTQTVDGGAVPSLVLCGDSLTPDADDAANAISRTFSSPGQVVRHDVFGSIPGQAALAKIRNGLSSCTESARRTKTGTLPVRVRTVGAMPGLVAARLTAQSSGQAAENLVLAGVRGGDLHLITVYDTRAKGAGALAFSLQKWLSSPP